MIKSENVIVDNCSGLWYDIFTPGNGEYMRRACEAGYNNMEDHEETKILEGVMTFDVEFTGMTEEDFIFLRQLAMKQGKEESKHDK